MENVEALNEKELEAAVGGKGNINTTDWTGAHWQATQHGMGTTFYENGYKWYRIKAGDTLGAIAKAFGTTAAQLQANNPATIKNVNQIYAGDAIVISRA